MLTGRLHRCGRRYGSHCVVSACASARVPLLHELALGSRVGRRELSRERVRKILVTNCDLDNGVCGSCSDAVSAGSRMTDAAGWAACAAPCTRAATHRILASHTERMLGSPPCACMASRIAAHPRHWKPESAASALESGRTDRPESGKGVRAKLAAQRVHPQLAIGHALAIPLAHRELGTFRMKMF